LICIENTIKITITKEVIAVAITTECNPEWVVTWAVEEEITMIDVTEEEASAALDNPE
jgi:hypothetical protein